MAGMTYDDVHAFAMRLPGTTVGQSWGHRTWSVGSHAFAWERPFTKADIKRFGDETPPAGEILGVRVENLDAKDALLAMGLRGFFTIEHFNNYPAILIALAQARPADVRRAVEEASRLSAARKPRATKKAAPTPTRSTRTPATRTRARPRR